MVWRVPSHQSQVRFPVLTRQRPSQGHSGHAVIVDFFDAEQVLRDFIKGSYGDDIGIRPV